MNWFDCLEAFVSVAQQQSFSAAARALNTNSSDITKRIQWMEKQLETALFLRTTRQVSLTDTGEYFLTRIQPLLNEWHDLYAQLLDFKAKPQGVLKIAGYPQLFSTAIMSKCLSAFAKTYPTLSLHLSTTSQPINLLENDVDILIAIDKYIVNPAETVSSSLFDFQYSLFASAHYLKTAPPLKKLSDLHAHRCLIYLKNNVWEFERESITVDGYLYADSGDALIEASKAGSGICRVPAFMVKNDVAQNKLINVLPQFVSKKQLLKIFFLKHSYQPRKIKVFVDFVKGSLK